MKRAKVTLGAGRATDIRLPHLTDQPVPTIMLAARVDIPGQPDTVLKTDPQMAGQISEPAKVNDTALINERRLQDGDVISLGPYRFRYENLRRRNNGHHRRSHKSWN